MRRLIFHIDVNNAYLSWSAVKRLSEDPASVDIRTVPAIIGGDQDQRHGVVLSKSEPAKRFGVRTGESVMEARRKCRSLLIVPPDRMLYKSCSEAFREILLSHTDKIEPFSIDECFADLTESPEAQADPVWFADSLRREISEKLGFTVNIGISECKVLAKTASDFQKPDRTHTLFRAEMPEKFWPLGLRELLYVGAATARRFGEAGIRTIGELAAQDREAVYDRFGKNGLTLWRYANGIDDSEVHTEAADNKGYSCSVTLPEDVRTAEEADAVLLSLAETVSRRLRRDGVYVRTVGVGIKYFDFKSVSHQKTMETATDITADLYDAARKLFREKWNGRPVRLLGLQTGNVTKEKTTQLSLFSDESAYEKQKKAEVMADRIKERFGKNLIKRGIFLNYDEQEF